MSAPSSMQPVSPAELAAVLPELVFLQGETEESRSELAQMAICHTYPRRNILSYHGDPGDAVYIVLRGRVKLSLMNEEGREVILTVMQRGSAFGLVEALDGGSHPATAVTQTPCRLARIPADRFLAWLRQHPRIHQRVVIGLAQLVRDAYGKVGAQALLPVKRRLHATLLEIARSDGQPEGEEVVLAIPTHQELAERVGSSRVVVSRIMKELIEEEDLNVKGRVLRLPMSALVLQEEF